MLDKLNEIANMVAEAISAHPDNKKKKKKAAPVEGSADEEALEPASQEQSEESAASRAQKSIRKNFGGLKEPS